MFFQLSDWEGGGGGGESAKDVVQFALHPLLTHCAKKMFNIKVYSRKRDLPITSAAVYCKYSGFCSC